MRLQIRPLKDVDDCPCSLSHSGAKLRLYECGRKGGYWWYPTIQESAAHIFALAYQTESRRLRATSVGGSDPFEGLVSGGAPTHFCRGTRLLEQTS